MHTKRDLQKRLSLSYIYSTLIYILQSFAKESSIYIRKRDSHSLLQKRVVYVQKRPTKENYKKELQKRPTGKTYKRELEKRRTKESDTVWLVWLLVFMHVTCHTHG